MDYRKTVIRPWSDRLAWADLRLLDPPGNDDLLWGRDRLNPDDDTDVRHLRDLARLLACGPVWRCHWLPASVGATLARTPRLGPVSAALASALARDVLAFHRHRPRLTVCDRQAVRLRIREFLIGQDPAAKPGQSPPLPVDQAIALWQRYRRAWWMNRQHVRAWTPPRRREAQQQLLELGLYDG